jgi:hypothetical protein
MPAVYRFKLIKETSAKPTSNYIRPSTVLLLPQIHVLT